MTTSFTVSPITIAALNNLAAKSATFNASSGYINAMIGDPNVPYTITTTASNPPDLSNAVLNAPGDLGTAMELTLLNGQTIWDHQVTQTWTGTSLNDYNIIPGTTTIPNTGGLYPNIFPIPTPNNVPTEYNIPPAPAPIDLDSLEEGIHDIKGGKIIIKKIKVTEEELDAALEETLGHEPSPEEKSALREELEKIAASEEREI